MKEFFSDFFSRRDAFARGVRAAGLAAAAALLTPPVQAALVAALGPYGGLVAALAAAVSGAVAVGEKNETK